MYFIDLEKLKIISSYNFLTREIQSIVDITTASISQMKEVFDSGVKEMFREQVPDIEMCFVYRLPGFNSAEADKHEAEAFLTAVNVIISCFFKYITLDSGRKREHRLDIPDRLSCVNASKGVLKKAVNQQTRVQKFNLKVIYKDLEFLLVDDRTIAEKEFVHSVDELEVSNG